ncbi:DUF2087 domain-containing protein [Micromonospora zhanjiangensis]|uniref:DUF2087 domain-containing protein n=1 Tax=Micromonospora zhanjiangensis TaxID=1522057 RepID=A0ABV8KLI6_9ACTN
MTPEQFAGLLAEPDRLAAFAAVVLGADSPSEVGRRAGLGPKETDAALRRLTTGGLVTAVDGRLVARTDAAKTAVRENAPARAVDPTDLDPDPDRAAVLRNFIRDGRIERLPAAQGKRQVVLEHVVAVFEPGVRYPEREVNAILRAWYDDHAALRRYLVDAGLLSRADALYWRSGGPVDVTGPTERPAGEVMP